MLTFAQPMLLWGMLALLAPLLLHLLNRRQPRLLVFPSIRFLTRAQLPREGRRRLRDKLLLLMRMMILTAAVTLLAGPRWTPKPTLNQQTQTPRAIFLLDNSASMQGHEAAARAVAMIEKELSALKGWEVGLVIADREVVTSLEPGATADSVRAALAAYSPDFLAGEPTAGLHQALSWLETGGQRRLILVSDLQRGDWEGVTAGLSADIELSVLDAGQDGIANVGISSVNCIALPGGGRRILVTVRNYGSVSQERTLTVVAGGNQLQQTVTLTALQQRRVVFVMPEAALPEGTVSQAVARLNQDGYTLDDEYHFWMGEVPAPAALLVLPAEIVPAAEETEFFVRHALQAEDGGVPGFAVETIVSDLLSEVNLANFRAFFLLGSVEDLPIATLETLARHVSAVGAVVFVTPGAAPNQALLALRQTGLFAAQGQGLAGSGRDVSLGIGWVAPDSMLGGLYSKPQESDLFMFSIRRLLRLQVDASTQVLLRSLDGWPVLAEKITGSGRCYYFALDFSLGWSDFPLTTSFLPIVRELCLASVPSGYGVHRLQCGEPLAVTAELHSAALMGGGVAEPFVGWERPGLRQVGKWPVEVRVATRESMTERINADDLRYQLQPQNQVRQESLSFHTAGMTGRDWWKLCAWIMAVMMLAETVLRWNSGEQR